MVFEDLIAEKHKDMVSIALELSEAMKVRVDKIYVYAAYETMYNYNIFYQVGGNFFYTNELSDSPDIKTIIKALKIGNKDLQELHFIFKENNKPMPTEIKMVYDVSLRNLAVSYSYENKYSGSTDTTSDMMFKAWFDKVSQE